MRGHVFDGEEEERRRKHDTLAAAFSRVQTRNQKEWEDAEGKERN